MHAPIFAYTLLKLAARCNVDCSYCYWFRDESVYNKPKILTLDAEISFAERLEAHLRQFALDEFTVLLHGGEPLLIGKARLRNFLERLEGVEARTGCKLVYMITTNGVLVDKEWAELFSRFGVHVSISIDGPAEVHDQHRLDFAGHGSHAQAVRAIETLRTSGTEPGVIAVCNVDHDPSLVLRYIVGELGITKFDILPPDFTHDDTSRSIAAYYIRLFDRWFADYASRGVRIPLLDGIIGGLLGQQPVTDSIGAGPVHTVTMLTDGSLEPLDVLRIGGQERTKTSLNIATHTLQDVTNDPIWRAAYEASLNLCDQCDRCVYREACGGGHLAHRWSKARGYDNPSVYCSDWMAIFEHVWSRIVPEMQLEIGEDVVSLEDAFREIGVPPLANDSEAAPAILDVDLTVPPRIAH